MGTCTRCGTPRTGADRCSFCGMSFAVITAAAAPLPASPPPPPINYPDAISSPARTESTPPWRSTPQLPGPPQAPVPVGDHAESSDAATILWSVGRVLGGYLLACVLLVTVLALTLTSGTNPFDWVRGAVVLAALGLRSRLSVTDEGDGTSATMSAGFTPALLLFSVLAGAFFVARQAEQRAISRDHAHAVLRSVGTAAAMTAALALLIVVTRFDSGVGGAGLGIGASATVGAQLLPLLLQGFPLLTAAFVAGRSAAHRAVSGAPSLREACATATQGVSEWLPPIVLHVALSALAMAVVVLGYGLHDGGLGDIGLRGFGGLVLFLLLSVNAGVIAAAVVMGIGVHASGSGTFGGEDQNVGLLFGDVKGVELGWILVPLAIALLVGVRQAYRRPAAPWWHGGVASLTVWVVLAFVLRTTFSIDGGGQEIAATSRFELVTLVLFSFLYGALLQFGGRALAVPVVERAPGLARFLGHRTPLSQALPEASVVQP